jgi:hypothetical protein
MSSRQFEIINLTNLKTSRAHQPDVPGVEAAQQDHHGSRTRVAIGRAGSSHSQDQAAALAQASGGQLGRAGDALLQLQRAYGNRHVQRVVECATPAPVIQTKLVLGPTDDRSEREADRVARQVAGGDASGRVMRAPAIQRLANAAGGAVDAGVQQAIQQARGSGQPLPEHVRAPMEQAFGVDFSGVKVHTDAQSDQLNRSIQAKAFTTGQDIFFRQGAYAPGSRGGQGLLAHELTHVVQQTGYKRSAWSKYSLAREQNGSPDYQEQIDEDRKKGESMGTPIKSLVNPRAEGGILQAKWEITKPGNMPELEWQVDPSYIGAEALEWRYIQHKFIFFEGAQKAYEDGKTDEMPSWEYVDFKLSGVDKSRAEWEAAHLSPPKFTKFTEKYPVPERPKQEEYKYEFTPEKRTKVEETFKEKGLKGICTAWAVDWVMSRARSETTREKPYEETEISDLVEKHKEYIAQETLESYIEAKFSTSRIEKLAEGGIRFYGESTDEGIDVLEGLEKVKLDPNCAYIFELNQFEHRSGGGHTFALYMMEDESMYYFDQNYGLLLLKGGLPRLHQIVSMELGKVWRRHLQNPLFGWKIFKVVPDTSDK